MATSASFQDPNKKLSTAAEELSGISKDERVSTCQNLPRHEVFHRKQFLLTQEQIIGSFLHFHGPQLRCYPDSVDTSGGDVAPLLLEFDNKLPSSIFTGENIFGVNGNPIKIILVHGKSKKLVTVGPLSVGKVEIVALDGDFGHDKQEKYWTECDFSKSILREREGRPPLLTGELSFNLQDGVGCLKGVIFTDHSSWIRSRRFRLGARIINQSPTEARIREAVSEGFIVRDRNVYTKCYPPHLGDKVSRLEKISFGGCLHRRLAAGGIHDVKDFLRLYMTDSSVLRNIVGRLISDKTWEGMVKHALSCVVDDKEYYSYNPESQKPGILFNSIYKVIGATFDGRSYLPLDKLTLDEMHSVEKMKQQALQNLNDLLPVDATSLLAHDRLTDLRKEPVGLELCPDVSLHQQDSEPAQRTEPMEQDCSGCVDEVLPQTLFAAEATPVHTDGTVQMFQDKYNLSYSLWDFQEPAPTDSTGAQSSVTSQYIDNSYKHCIEPLHGAEECDLEMKLFTDNHNKKESASAPSEDMNSKVLQHQDVGPDFLLIGSTTENDLEQCVWEMKSHFVVDNSHEKADSCCIDSDSEGEMVTRARRKHQKLTASESFHHDIQIPEVHTCSSLGAASEDRCFPVAMSIDVDANIGYKKVELSSECDQIDDASSWELFRQNAGEVIDVAEIHKIAKDLVRECGRDLRSITLIAKALRDMRDIEIWEYALDSLSVDNASCPDDSKILLVNVLKLSIGLLEDDVTRACLKSFTLQGKNSGVARASLINSWISEGMLATHNEGEKVISNLLERKLLELSENGEFVKCLDLDQHAVDLIFQPEEGCEFLLQGGMGLEEPPEVGEWEMAKVICLMHNDLTELPENLRCARLSTLYLQRNPKLRMIPPSFFSHMPALEVLNLSRTRIKSLPDSLFQLISLKRLFLNECILLRMLSKKVGQLKNLEVLDLEGTKLMGLPKEIEQLINLTCLDVSILGGGSKVADQMNPLIPSGLLSALSLLEELNIDVGPEAEWWDSYVEGLLNELCSLGRLTALKLYFPKVELLRQFNAQFLTLFRIVVGKHIGRIMSRLPPDIEFELERWDRCLKYIHGEGILEDVVKVLKQADAIFLDRHVDLKKFSDFGKENLEQLRCCVLGECNELQVLIHVEDFKEEGDGITLGSLEYLYVYYMKNLEAIWRGPVPKGSLSCLKSLTLRTCPRVISIFTPELLENLCNLEELVVEDCPGLSSLVSCKYSGQSEAPFYMPALRKMSLHYLPELTSISGGLQIAPRVEWLSFYDCPNLKSLDLSVREVKRIRGQRDWWESLEWTGDRPDNLDTLFVTIDACTIP